jgi:hypothetical protein
VRPDARSARDRAAGSRDPRSASPDVTSPRAPCQVCPPAADGCCGSRGPAEQGARNALVEALKASASTTRIPSAIRSDIRASRNRRKEEHPVHPRKVWRSTIPKRVVATAVPCVVIGVDPSRHPAEATTASPGPTRYSAGARPSVEPWATLAWPSITKGKPAQASCSRESGVRPGTSSRGVRRALARRSFGRSGSAC